MFLLRQFGKSVLLAISTAALLIAGTPLFATEAFGLVKRYVDLYEVNFPHNPSANASILIRKYVVAEDHPADWEWPENITSWSINVSGLHCMGNHQQPDGHAEWTRQASYGLYVNGLRMLTFNEGCARNQGYGDFQTVIEVLVELPFDPMVDDLVAEVALENDDGFGTCDGISPCDNALLRGEDIIEP